MSKKKRPAQPSKQDEHSEPVTVGETNVAQPVEMGRVLQFLQQSEMSLDGLLPYSSNYTFLVTLSDDELTGMAVYKPRRGESPLWDFPRGTLCQREVAAFLVSNALGWNLVPPTVLRDGLQGLGMVQLYIDHDPDANFFTFRDELPPELPLIALFDVIINNADRKGGHCLRAPDGRIWCIDHGIAFHSDYKLRTVIWDFAGAPIPDEVLDDLKQLQSQLTSPETPLHTTLTELLSPNELAALGKRLERLINNATFPEPGPGRHVPWPLI
jgi:uncharacterized repeat protein (TIGR03843 family)